MIHQKINLYPHRTDVTLTSYILDNPDELNITTRPSVIINPGGAYLLCSHRESEPVALAFNTMCYNAFVLHYSVYGENNQHPDLSDIYNAPVVERSIYPGPMVDLAHAMLYVKGLSHLGIDPERVAICGFSAGGHNCAMYATHYHRPLLTQALGVSSEQLRPAACILAYPVIDYGLMKPTGTTSEHAKQVYAACSLAYTGTTNPDDDYLQKISANHFVDAHTPPTFIWHTYEDEPVPPTQATAYAHQLGLHGVPFELHVFEKGIHGLSLASQVTAAGNSAMLEPDAAEWVSLCQR